MQSRSGYAELFFFIALFALFVICSGLLIILGGGIYEQIGDDMDVNYAQRVSLSYVSTKIRQGDAGGIGLESLSGAGSALVIEETYDDAQYCTYVYYHSGGIYEMFTEKGYEFLPEDGVRIMDIEGFDMSLGDDGLYLFEARSGGAPPMTLCVSPRAGR